MDNDLSKKISTLDNIYADYLMKKIDSKTLAKQISIVLTSLDFSSGKKEITVSLVLNDKKEDFFGMRIFPSIDGMNSITSTLTNEKKSFKDICNMWRNLEKWNLEIDSNVFNREELNFVPKELTALTLHEIGHIIYSDKPIEQFYRAYRESYMRMKIADRASLKYLYLLYNIPLSIACSTRCWVNGKNEINQEKFADKILKDAGYTEALLTAINKIIKAYGNDSGYNEEVSNKKIETSINWCNLNVNDLTKRKNTLKDELYYQTLKTNSPYIKALTMKILYDLGVGLHENYTGSVVEATLEGIESEDFIHKYSSFYDIRKFGQLERNMNMAIESYQIALESKRNEIKLPSQYDIDAIYVECDRITNHSDRVYVLDLIWDKLTQINEFEEMIQSDRTQMRKYGETINSMRNELQEMRKNVLGKHNLNSEYKLFVKYPKGYEG